MLKITGLSKRFGSFVAVNQVSFEVEEGEILGLIGPNGSGKSTIFNVVAGMYKPTAGSIVFQGREIGGLPAHQVCQLGIGRTFQIPRPFTKLSIVENVVAAAFFGPFPRPSAKVARDRALEVLSLVGLDSASDDSIDGLGAAGLKKLELAKALATRPKLLLADEALGGLDAEEMIQAVDLLARIRTDMGITIVWVEHIMGMLMRVVGRVVVLDHGEKIFEGSPSACVEDPLVTECYLGHKQSARGKSVPAASNLA
jgi:branched-chain amino acid transport system ATP-binding protein